MRELLGRLQERGDFETVFVDLEDASTAADAVVEIVAASLPVRGVVRRIEDWVRKSSTGTIDRVDELGVSELRVSLGPVSMRAGGAPGVTRYSLRLPRASSRSFWRSTNSRYW